MKYGATRSEIACSILKRVLYTVCASIGAKEVGSVIFFPLLMEEPCVQGAPAAEGFTYFSCKPGRAAVSIEYSSV